MWVSVVIHAGAFLYFAYQADVVFMFLFVAWVAQDMKEIFG